MEEKEIPDIVFNSWNNLGTNIVILVSLAILVILGKVLHGLELH